MAKRKRKLRTHPAMGWSLLGKTVESIEIGPPDDVILTFQDGSRLLISSASQRTAFTPYQRLEQALSHHL
jgi:hypothetical protein